MPPSDKKEYGLVPDKVTLRLRHTAKTPQYTLPKPYRRTALLSDERPRSRLKLVFYAGSAALIAVLVWQIAEMARQNRRERELPIVAARVEQPPSPAAVLAAGAVPPESPAPNTSLNEPAPAPVVEPAGAGLAAVVPAEEAAPDASAPLLPQNVPPVPVRPARDGLAAPVSMPRKPKPARLPAVPEPAEALDPDVVLITAILTLAPLILGEESAPPPACIGPDPRLAGCADLHGLVP